MSTVADERRREDAVRERFARLLAEIAAAAPDHERTRELPYAEVRRLAQAGFGALRLPPSEGGGGLSLTEFFALLVEVAAADSNQPQIWRNHIAFVEDRLQPEPERKNSHWRSLIADGAVIGGAWSERHGKFTESNTRITPAGGGGWAVSGAKYYSTGSIFADWISVAAKRDDEDLIVIVDVAAPGVECEDDWTGFGQRTTGSGTTVLRDVALSDLAIYAFEERAPYQEAVYQLVHLATLAGIALAAQRDVVAELRGRERAYGQGLDEVPARDAQLQAVVGRVCALAASAQASVARAAGRLDRTAELAIADDAADEHVTQSAHEAAIAVYEAQLTVTDDVLDATTILFDALGSSALDVSKQLDRHWRNARTISSHNPRVYKERVVGDWYLNGTAPKIHRSGEQKLCNGAPRGAGGQPAEVNA